MYVHRSNRMEVLVDELAAALRKPRVAPLAPETIVIQGQGMERWLARELAQRLGGFANACFPFPRTFLGQALSAVLGPAPDELLFERDTMGWAIAALLPTRSADRAFAPVTTYLAEDVDGVRRLQLARKIAHLFDQYVIYRPRLVLDWEKGRGKDWQAVLWRALLDHYDGLSSPAEADGRPRAKVRGHFAARAAEFTRLFSPLFVERGALPARLCVVGGASLPPLFLHLLAELGKAVEVHLFCLVPSREYLGQGSLGGDALDWAADTLDLHPLLASLGGVGAAFQQLLEGEGNYVEGAAQFVDPASDTLLHALQSDLLNNRVTTFPRPLAPEQDDSICLLSCHSPMREIEVLRDRLLDCFDRDPTLRPDDVVVMAPRMESYVPLVQAVFSGESREAEVIPYRLADRSERRVNRVAEAFLRLLEVLRGRLKASEVLDLLQAEPVRLRQGIEAADLAFLYGWVHDAGIRWAEDAVHRTSYGLPADAAHTWRRGLDRLLLGLALSDDERTQFAGVVPYEHIASDQGELLGKFVRFCENLFKARQLAGESRSVSEWGSNLRRLIESFLTEAEGSLGQLGSVYGAVLDLEASAGRAGFEEPIPLETVSSLLAERFESAHNRTDFVSGGVTFCDLLPLRSIPFRVVYLLGLNDGEFPRIEQQLGFDKMAERPQLGDRSQRAEDRYLFLETLLSARERLFISYLGRRVQDNEERPPAVVVSELVAAIERSLSPPQAGHKEFLAPVQYPLQPFSPQSFDGSDVRLRSYAEVYAEGARALAGERHPLSPMFPAPLDAESTTALQPPHAGPAARAIDLSDIVRFFQNPARSLLTTLGLSLVEDTRLVEDREPVESDALVRYLVGSRLLSASELSLDDQEQAELARGMLPSGAPGRVALQRISEVARALRSTSLHITRHGAHGALLVSVECAGSWISGALEGLYHRSGRFPEGGQVDLRMVICSYARLTAKYELAAWIRHVVARAAGLPVTETLLLGRGVDQGALVKRFGPLPRAKAEEVLRDMIALYHLGQSVPLPLFPTLSMGFMQRVQRAQEDAGAEQKALQLAERQFVNPREQIEGHDVHVQWAFRGKNPFSATYEPSFAEVSRRVFGPLIEHAEELELGLLEDTRP